MPRRNDVVQVPTIALAFVVSLLVHVAALWLVVPRLHTTPDVADNGGRLAVRLTPRSTIVASTTPPVTPTPKPSPERVEPTPPPKAAPPPSPPRVAHAPKRTLPPSAPRRAPPAKDALPRTTPPALAADTPAPRLAEPAPIARPPEPPRAIAAVPEAKPAPMPPPPTEDLAAYVEARRRARGEAPASESTESDIERRNRIVASNLGLDRTPTFGDDPRNAGGLFQIVEIGYDDARFYFFGFDRAIRRNARQLIEVRKGANADIRIAIVRSMIAIVREKSRGDFVWVSHRLGRAVTLSARPEDNAGLEEFILRDVFAEARVP